MARPSPLVQFCENWRRIGIGVVAGGVGLIFLALYVICWLRYVFAVICLGSLAVWSVYLLNSILKWGTNGTFYFSFLERHSEIAEWAITISIVSLILAGIGSAIAGKD